MYQITIPEDSGNIEVVNQLTTPGGIVINLRIREDYKNINFRNSPLPECNNPRKRNFFQWFYFHCDLQNDDLKNTEICLNILNAKDVFVPQWNKNRPDRAWALTDKNDWHRVSTVYNEETGVLTCNLPSSLHVEFAFYPPYPYARHCELVNSAKKCKKTILGYSIEHRPIHLLDLLHNPVRAQNYKFQQSN